MCNLTCSRNSCNYIKDINKFENEVKTQILLKEISPKIYNYNIYKHKRKNVGFIDMEKIDGTFMDMLEDELSNDELDYIVSVIVDMLLYLAKNKIYHGDLHFGNIGYKFKNKNNKSNIKDDIKPYLIDFGMSRNNVVSIEMELLKTIKSLDIKVQKRMNTKNRQYLIKKLYDIYIQLFEKWPSDKQFSSIEEIPPDAFRIWMNMFIKKF